MGVFTTLLTLPLAPARGVVWLADRLADEAERQLYDASAIRAQLDELAAALDRGELDEDEYDRIEEDLLRQMRQVTGPLNREGGL
jgi:hypothetical protein